MPRGDGTGPDGASGCRIYGLPYGFFRNNRGTGIGRFYGRGGGMGRGMGRGQGIYPGRGPFSNLQPYMNPEVIGNIPSAQYNKELLVQEKNVLQQRLNEINGLLSENLKDKINEKE